VFQLQQNTSDVFSGSSAAFRITVFVPIDWVDVNVVLTSAAPGTDVMIF
jgi:hypothetical protein